ncbi:Chondroitin sulfate synthase 1 [Basidiobolus ranarum]|uniref:Chondroitin sulfate synthase 1 n=1 Tax=Basidiobolus ranarum TaxID=34480 RepID=A0ABR2WQT2_9FUNG
MVNSLKRVFSAKSFLFICTTLSVLLLFIFTLIQLSTQRVDFKKIIEVEGHQRGESRTLLSLVLTSKEYLDVRARAVGDTWGLKAKAIKDRRNSDSQVEVRFITDEDTSEYGLKNVPVEDTEYSTLYKKTFKAFYYVYQHYLNDFEWFMKVDDDTYVKLHRLMKHLNNPQLDHNEPLLFGRTGRDGVSCWGGPGYVMNRKTLSIVGPYIPYCLSNAAFQGPEDVQFAHCLEYAYNQTYSDGNHPRCQGFPDGHGQEFLHVLSNSPQWERVGYADELFKVEEDHRWIWSFGKSVTIHSALHGNMYKVDTLYGSS